MDKGNKKDWRTRRLANTFRFADNFTALNNGGEVVLIPARLGVK